MNSMEPLARHELCRRMAAVGNEFIFVGYLTDPEVDQVTSFLGPLTFNAQEENCDCERP